MASLPLNLKRAEVLGAFVVSALELDSGCVPSAMN